MNTRDKLIKKAHIIQAILDNTTAVIYAKNKAGKYELINRRFEELFDVTGEEIEGQTDLDFFPAEMAKSFAQNDRLVLQGNAAIEFEEIAPHDDGPHTYISLKFPYHDDEGNAIGTCGISTDITPRKKAEAALAASEERFRELAEHVPECFWITDVASSQVLYASPSFERIWGHSCDELYRNPEVWIEAIEPADRTRVADAFRAMVSTGKFQEEYRIIRPDGTMRWIADRGVPIRNEAGEVYRVAGIAEDVTERRYLEKQVTEISSQERQRISHELHDSLGQQLTGLTYLARTTMKKLREKTLPEAEAVGVILQGLQASLIEVGRIVRGLAPVDVDSLGLEAALRELVANIDSHAPLTCHFTCPQPFAVEDNAVATQLFRIAQEAANNAVRHAEAANLTIDLCVTNKILVLQIRDDGRGMDPNADFEGMGLGIMRYRSAVIGALFEIDSTEKGTTITCSLPLQ